MCMYVCACVYVNDVLMSLKSLLPICMYVRACVCVNDVLVSLKSLLPMYVCACVCMYVREYVNMVPGWVLNRCCQYMRT